MTKIIQDFNQIQCFLYVKSRFGSLLKNGFEMTGHKYQFLGYLMSGLKNHSVWFVPPFQFQNQFINSEHIRQSLVHQLTVVSSCNLPHF
jgi:hypothetical protein